MGDLRDELGPNSHNSNNVREPAVVSVNPDPSKMPASLKDELAELMVVRATCPSCGNDDYYVVPPDGWHDWECTTEACPTILSFNR